ncbi:PREDICTED: uncharacterized protein LOC103336274 [Prunus mume]|uniref:Uncharacterized protein LOC103336274 n=1 Tax=Prunus mume TaxID=102107 RepID=A0ABM0PCB4_PRUMU|nr:PREDICTED: uncharacterized protein LOC103336274 [Prunus mume]
MHSHGKAIQNFFNDDSDDDDLHQQRVAMAVQHHTFLLEQYAQQSKHGGFVAGREYKNQKREKYHKSLMEYFCERPLYPPVDFRRRFHMRRELFYHILKDVVAYEPYFTQKIDACGQQSLSPGQKLTAIFECLHMDARQTPLTSIVDWVNLQPLNVCESFVLLLKLCMVSGTSVPQIMPTFTGSYTRLVAEDSQAYKKDTERPFGILQAQWAIVRGLARMWRKEQLHSIMMTCIILYNMIVEDEYEDLDVESDDEDNCPRISRRARARLAYDLEPTITYDINRDRQTISDMVRHNRVRASQVHHNLRNDLINHIWRCEGEGQ